MDSRLIVLLTAALGLMILIMQRTEPKYRRLVGLVMAVLALVTIWYVATVQVWGEAGVALVLALFLNFLFWVLIGRYNPVGSSDDTHVLGMDD